MKVRTVKLQPPFELEALKEIDVYREPDGEDEGITHYACQKVLGLHQKVVTQYAKETFMRPDVPSKVDYSRDRSITNTEAVCVKLSSVEEMMKERCGWEEKKIALAMKQLYPSSTVRPSVVLPNPKPVQLVPPQKKKEADLVVKTEELIDRVDKFIEEVDGRIGPYAIKGWILTHKKEFEEMVQGHLRQRTAEILNEVRAQAEQKLKATLLEQVQKEWTKEQEDNMRKRLREEMEEEVKNEFRAKYRAETKEGKELCLSSMVQAEREQHPPRKNTSESSSSPPLPFDVSTPNSREMASSLIQEFFNPT